MDRDFKDLFNIRDIEKNLIVSNDYFITYGFDIALKLEENKLILIECKSSGANLKQQIVKKLDTIEDYIIVDNKKKSHVGKKYEAKNIHVIFILPLSLEEAKKEDILKMNRKGIKLTLFLKEDLMNFAPSLLPFVDLVYSEVRANKDINNKKNREKKRNLNKSKKKPRLNN